MVIGGITKAQSLAPVPQLTERVVDAANVLTPEEKESLKSTLKKLEVEKGSQVAILLVKTTAPEPIEAFSLRVAEQWKLGREKINDGAILVLAMNDRTMRLEVGYGLEGALNDATSKRILDDIMRPYLQRSEYFEGLRAAIEAISRVVSGEPLPVPHRPSTDDPQSAIIVLVIVGVFLSVLFSGFTTRAQSGLLASLVVLIAGSIFAAFMSGVVASFFVYFLTVIDRGRGFSIGRGGGSFGGGDIFTGGGGSFGGGGASSRW